MGFIVKLLKLKIVKILLSIILISFIASLFFFKDWYYVQYQKCIGFYYVHQGDRAYKNQKYQKAIDYYKIALNKYPGHSRASCNLGNIYVSFENYYEAVDAYENALKYSPNFMVCRMDLGIVLSEKMADYDKAIQEYGRIVNTHPFMLQIPFLFDSKKSTSVNKGLAYYNMGLAYRGKSVFMGDNSNTANKYLKKAKEAYENAEKYLKNDYDNTYNLALTNHLLGEYEDAGEKYCEAINIKPDSFEAHYNFGFLLRAMNKNQEALSEFEKTTLLLDYYGDGKRSKYIYGIINEIKRRILNEGKFETLKNRDSITSIAEKELVYSKGKILISKQKDFKIKELLKCTYNKK